MPPVSTPLLCRLLLAGAGSFLLAMASCAPLPPTAAVAIPPVPAGEARAWFYRDPGPYDHPAGTVAHEVETPAAEPVRQPILNQQKRSKS